jgi:hypothetical protein
LRDELKDDSLLEKDADATTRLVNPAPDEADRELMVVVKEALVAVSLVENELE